MIRQSAAAGPLRRQGSADPAARDSLRSPLTAFPTALDDSALPFGNYGAQSAWESDRCGSARLVLEWRCRVCYTLLNDIRTGRNS